MPSPSFQSLAQELLDAGIAPKYAERLCRELEDHYRDLEREALANERSAHAAELEARRRLGTNAAIAREFMSRPELKSWIYRSRALIRCLRGACVVYLGLRSAAHALAAYRAAFVRCAMAAAAAVALTAALLLGLTLSVSPGPPSSMRTFAAVQTAAPGRASAGPAAEPGEPAHAREAAESGEPAGAREAAEPGETAAGPTALDSVLVRAARPGYERPSIPMPELPDADLGVRPMAAVELEPAPELAPLKPADADLLPIVKVAPQFPALAARRGLEGYVLIEYTVTRTGSVSDVVVVESSSEVFEQPALEAVSQFKYKPRVVDGRAVPVRGVRARMRFVLDA